MSIHARAPLRIDFAGGWSDDVAFADAGGGCVVSAAIAMNVHVDILTGGKTIRIHSEDAREHVTISTPAQLVYDGKLDRHKASLNMLPLYGGIEVLSRSDAPFGSGLGEAAATDIALLAGLARGRMEDYDGDDLVELGIMLEHGELGASGRRQDYYPAAFGGFHELNFTQGQVQRRRLSVSESAAADLASHLVLMHTGQTHFSAQTYRRIMDSYRAADERVVGALNGIRDAAKEVPPAIESGDWKTLAALVDYNWERQKILDATMTTQRTRTIETAVRDAGAWGLKAVGEGAGGCMVALCPPDRRDSIVNAANELAAAVLNVEFAFEGVAVEEREDASEAG